MVSPGTPVFSTNKTDRQDITTVCHLLPRTMIMIDSQVSVQMLNMEHGGLFRVDIPV